MVYELFILAEENPVATTGIIGIITVFIYGFMKNKGAMILYEFIAEFISLLTGKIYKSAT
jgi:hypothetical protein